MNVNVHKVLNRIIFISPFKCLKKYLSNVTDSWQDGIHMGGVKERKWENNFIFLSDRGSVHLPVTVPVCVCVFECKGLNILLYLYI